MQKPTRILLGAIEARLRGTMQSKKMGSAPASGAVRRAPAPNSGPGRRTIRVGITPQCQRRGRRWQRPRRARSPYTFEPFSPTLKSAFFSEVFLFGAQYTY